MRIVKLRQGLFSARNMKTLSFLKLAKFGFRFSFFLLPAVVITAPFFIDDPFKVLYHHDDFYHGAAPPFVTSPRGYVSATLYLRNREKYRYDSFIFGSSRSLAFLTKDWKHYIGPSAPFHFDAWGESLFGLWATLKFLDKSEAPIRNVLLILDPSLLRGISESKKPIDAHHPIISGVPWAKFYTLFLKAYMSGGFWIGYWDLKIFKTHRPYMQKYFTNQQFLLFDPVTNDCRFAWREHLIAVDPEKYYDNKAVFYPRNSRAGEKECEMIIKEKQLTMLREINAIFKKHRAHYKVVVSPLYDQKKINAKDLKTLEAVFGTGRVYNYSGVNALTNNVRNYYETSHYKPDVARTILSEIYTA